LKNIEFLLILNIQLSLKLANKFLYYLTKSKDNIKT